LAALLWLISPPVAAATHHDDPAAALRSRFASAPVWVIGERHRSAMGHRLFFRLVREALEAGERVLVGLEVPKDRQLQLDSVLAGRGGRVAPVVIDCPSYRDLLERLGDLRRERPGGLEVRAIDAPWGSDADRDAYMAATLEGERFGWDRVLVLVGNLHALRWVPQHREPLAQRLAARLAQAGVGVASVLQLDARQPPVEEAGTLLPPDSPTVEANLRRVAALLGVPAGGTGRWLHRLTDAVVLRP
jgi:hypothetical protein